MWDIKALTVWDYIRTLDFKAEVSLVDEWLQWLIIEVW
jgi:hypothetical protein